MKILNLLLMLTLLSSTVFSAQLKMRVEGKAKLTSDICTMARLKDGRVFNNVGAIKVKTDLEGLSFKANMGIANIETLSGMYVIKLQEGEGILRVYAKGYKPLAIKLGDLGIRLKATQTWEFFLTGEKQKLTVTVITNPKEAKVLFDGKDYGDGPTYNVPQGEHNLLISKSGYRLNKQIIEVAKGKQYFNINLKEVDMVKFSIKSNPSGARVYVNGSYINKNTPCSKLYFPGNYNIRLELDGYDRYENTITISENGATISPELVKNTGVIKVLSSLSGITWYVNGEISNNLENGVELPPGKYKIEGKKQGYKDYKKIINLGKGKGILLRANLIAKYGKLNIEVYPDDVKGKIIKDGVVVKTFSGTSVLRLKEGIYNIEIKKNGYRSVKKRIDIRDIKAIYFDISMKKGNDAPKIFVFVEGGTFDMGSNDGGDMEKPVHSVTVSDFYIGKYEVTQSEYESVMGSNPSYFKGEERPVEQVSWFDVIEYCNKKSEQDGLKPFYTIDKTTKDPNNKNSDDNLKWTITSDWTSDGYRLPTEAEWEFAAKGGNSSNGYTYSGSNTVDDVAWHKGNSYNDKHHPVGEKLPNELGLYDMSGNVWEWCFDWFGYYSSESETDPTGAESGSYRVFRGGGWNIIAYYCRSVYRYSSDPDDRYSSIGFRVVKNIAK